MYEDIAIDIHCAKLLDWLISRRICNRSWQEHVMKIRQLISKAILDMPEHAEIRDMLSGTYLTYYHCLRIVEILRVTESDSKNIFGRYSSQRMTDWQEIIDLYEKESVYLAEAAELLQQFAQFQIPSLKKQVQKLENSEQECERKTEEYNKRYQELEKLFHEQCHKFNIKGENVSAEIVALADSLPERLELLAQEVRSIWPVAEQYLEFQEIVHRRKLSPKDRADKLKMLRYLRENGNTTVFEWNRGQAPSKIEDFRPNLLLVLQYLMSLPSVLQNPQFIDAKPKPEQSVDSGNKIDFGEEDICTRAEEEIDFKIEELASGDITDSLINGDIATAAADTVARGVEALTILEHRPTLQLLLADLKEIEAFLRMRTIEVSSEKVDFIMSSNLSTDLRETESSVARQLQDVTG
ncbi:unnamed protein product, partial [Soboliphyme baturini]|uniref:CDK5 regulatory subunit associated protein 3 n=1 Tax=Soboliphyme baturini TaxID=241478 RepID=A0A183J1V8_9BILA